MSQHPGLSVERLSTIKPSATLQATIAAKKMRAEGIDVLNLAAGEPDMGTPNSIIEATKQALDDGFTRYTSARGDAVLIDAIISKMHQDYGVDYAAEEVIATVGAKGAISLALDATLEPGDEVILCAPFWVTYADVIRLSGGRPIVVQSDANNGFLPNIEDIKAAITAKTKMIVVNSPNNPTGRIWPNVLLDDLADVAKEHGLWLMSDDIYERVYYTEKRPETLIQRRPELKEHIIVINGVAKAYAMTGYRIGYTCGPKPLIDGMYKLQQQRLSHPSSMAQVASAYALSEPDIVQEDMRVMREAFQRRRDEIVPKLQAHPALTCAMPEGAFYAFVQVNPSVVARLEPGRKVAEILLQKAHVSVVAGEAFGCPHAFRLSFAVADDVLSEGVQRILDFFDGIIDSSEAGELS